MAEEKVTKTKQTSLLDDALAELRKERAKCVSNKLKEILDREMKARKILANIVREKEDYLAEVEQDEEDMRL